MNLPNEAVTYAGRSYTRDRIDMLNAKAILYVIMAVFSAATFISGLMWIRSGGVQPEMSQIIAGGTILSAILTTIFFSRATSVRRNAKALSGD